MGSFPASFAFPSANAGYKYFNISRSLEDILHMSVIVR